MYFVKIGELLYLRCPGLAEKTAEAPGMLSIDSIKQYKDVSGTDKRQPRRPANSRNPILRGMPATSARTAPPLVVTLGTSGV